MCLHAISIKISLLHTPEDSEPLKSISAGQKSRQRVHHGLAGRFQLPGVRGLGFPLMLERFTINHRVDCPAKLRGQRVRRQRFQLPRIAAVAVLKCFEPRRRFLGSHRRRQVETLHLLRCQRYFDRVNPGLINAEIIPLAPRETLGDAFPVRVEIRQQ